MISVEIYSKETCMIHYSKDIDTFLSFHDYEANRRGADLPWWRNTYFNNCSGQRTMIISQDSLSTDAGSVVFWANLYDVINNEDEYEQ